MKSSLIQSPDGVGASPVFRGAKGGATVELYQNGGCDECKVGCYPILQITRIFNVFYIFIYS